MLNDLVLAKVNIYEYRFFTYEKRKPLPVRFAIDFILIFATQKKKNRKILLFAFKLDFFQIRITQ